MSSNVESAHIGLTPAHLRSEPALQAALASLWRRKLLVAAIVATALVLGIIAVAVMPTRYTAEAYIRGGFAASDAVTKDDDNKSAGSISLDLVRVIETESRLLQSPDLARRVVQQLGLERLRPEVSADRWQFFGSAVNNSGDQDDRAATRLLRHLSVRSDPRAYLITVRYTAGDSNLAVLITNAFVTEFMRSARLQTLFQQRSSVQAMLSRQLTKFGDRHPRVTEAKMRLAATQDLLKEQLSEAPEVILQTAGENVTQAIAVTSSPNTRFVIGLLLMVGLTAGIGVALLLERGRWWWAHYYAEPFA